MLRMAGLAIGLGRHSHQEIHEQAAQPEEHECQECPLHRILPSRRGRKIMPAKSPPGRAPFNASTTVSTSVPSGLGVESQPLVVPGSGVSHRFPAGEVTRPTGGHAAVASTSLRPPWYPKCGGLLQGGGAISRWVACVVAAAVRSRRRARGTMKPKAPGRGFRHGIGGGGRNRTAVRRRSTVRTTCLVASLCSHPGAVDGQTAHEPVTLL